MIYYYTHLTVSFADNLDHIQIICTLLQTDNHTSISISYGPDVLPATKPTESKHWRCNNNNNIYF